MADSKTPKAVTDEAVTDEPAGDATKAAKMATGTKTDRPAPGPAGDTPREATPVPDGHRRVRWIYHPVKALMGKVADIHAERAAMLVAENRVAYVDPATPVDDDAAHLEANGEPAPGASTVGQPVVPAAADVPTTTVAVGGPAGSQ